MRQRSENNEGRDGARIFFKKNGAVALAAEKHFGYISLDKNVFTWNRKIVSWRQSGRGRVCHFPGRMQTNAVHLWRNKEDYLSSDAGSHIKLEGTIYMEAVSYTHLTLPTKA